VAELAGLLARLGVAKGDRVLIYMPMVPEAVVAMLATVRLGAVHSVVFGGFAAKELAARIRHAEPKVDMKQYRIIFYSFFNNINDIGDFVP
jgi:propionyl-CoA synthetase